MRGAVEALEGRVLLAAAPTDIALSNATVAENGPINVAIGTLSTTDPDAGDTFAYALVLGEGSADNASFTIAGDQLKAAVRFNYEAKNSYSIRVRTTDSGGLTLEEPFTIIISNVNEWPTNMALNGSSSGAEIAEHQPAGTFVGTFSTTDPDLGDSFTYSFLPDQAANDAAFQIAGNELRTAVTLDVATKSSYLISIRATDQGGLYYDKNYMIYVRNVSEFPPTDILMDNPSVAPGQAAGTLVASLGATDADVGEAFTYALVDGEGAADNGTFAVAGSKLRLAADITRPSGSSYFLRLRVTDSGGSACEKALTIRVRGLGSTYVVNSLADTVASDGVVTLREALEAANSNHAPTADVPPGSDQDTDRILFDLAALQTQAGAGNVPRIVLDGTVLQVSGHTDLVGPGADLLVLDGNGRSGVIEVDGYLSRMICLSGLTFTGGLATNDGGGGIRHSFGTLYVSDAKVVGNTATTLSPSWGAGYGGGIYSLLGDLFLKDVIVSGNLATTGTASDLAGGGGIYINAGTLTMANVLVSGNTAVASPNSSASGGGLGAFGSTVVLTNSALVGNRVSGGTYASGGGLDALNSTVTLANVVASANTVISAASYGFSWGGGMTVQNGALTVVNSTIAGNAVLAQAAMNAMGGGIATPVRLDNSIVSLNIAGLAADVLSSAAGSNNLIGADPLFVRNPSAGGDGQWGTADDDAGDLRLRLGSPAIDAGDSSLVPAGIITDLGGGPRIIGPAVDIGAYETDTIAPAVSAVSINDGASQRSMVKKLSVLFSEPVTLSASALTIRLSSGASIPATLTVTNPSADQKTYLLTFSGTGVTGGSLPDGIYDLIVTAAGVQDLTGNLLTADYTKRFHRLFGDADGNKVVNALDYAKLKATYGRSSADPLFNGAVDYEGNSVINALDLAQFRKRYGLSLSY